MIWLIIDSICTGLYLIVLLIFRQTEWCCFLNGAFLAGLCVSNMILYRKKKKGCFLLLLLCVIIFSSAQISVQLLNMQGFLIGVSLFCGVLIALITFKDKIIAKKYFLAVICAILISLAVFGEIQYMDRQLPASKVETVSASVQEKVTSGRFGLYEYTLYAQASNGEALNFDVTKNSYDAIRVNDRVSVIIRYGAFGIVSYELS